ncbi:hypothetical protein PCE1_000499 [Barthelona sp. PCE]
MFSHSNPLARVLSGVTCFTDGNRASMDIQQLVSQFPTLVVEQRRLPRGSNYVLGIILTGTIPMHFQGNQFNIPVTICPDYYPSRAPSVRVNPTTNMYVAPNHPFILSNGSCEHFSYLKHWQPHNTLSKLAAQLSNAFGQHTPLYAGQPQVNHQVSSFEQQRENRETLKKTFRTDLLNKFQKHFSDVKSNAELQLTQLQELVDQLESQHSNIDRNHTALIELKDRYVSNVDKIKGEISKLHEYKAKLDSTNQNDMGPEVCQNVWSNQTLESFSTNLAIDDTINSLQMALESENISPQDFVKEIRKLSKDQFVSRYMVDKIQKKRRDIGKPHLL